MVSLFLRKPFFTASVALRDTLNGLITSTAFLAISILTFLASLFSSKLRIILKWPPAPGTSPTPASTKPA